MDTMPRIEQPSVSDLPLVVFNQHLARLETDPSTLCSADSQPGCWPMNLRFEVRVLHVSELEHLMHGEGFGFLVPGGQPRDDVLDPEDLRLCCLPQL